MNNQDKQKWLKVTDEVEAKYRAAQWEKDESNGEYDLTMPIGNGHYCSIITPALCPYCLELGVKCRYDTITKCNRCPVVFAGIGADVGWPCGDVLFKASTGRTRKPIYAALKKIRAYLEGQ